MTSSTVAAVRIEDAFGQMLDKKLPNLFRLHLNPIVAQACLCLSRIASASGDGERSDGETYQIFLANGHDEALSGAIKLARYIQNLRRREVKVLIRGPRNRIAHFASTLLPGGRRISFLPDVMECFDDEESTAATDAESFGVVVSFATSSSQPNNQPGDDQLKILSVGSRDIFNTDGDLIRGWSPIDCPDVIVFDESWVHHGVPFSAFAAKSPLLRHWRKRTMSMFHSTTFQPNTITSLHLLNCLRRDAAAFMKSMNPTLERIETDRGYRSKVFSSLYSPSLARLIRTTGFDQSEPTATGHEIRTQTKRVFDAVGGVACSIRGHNPPSYLDEINDIESADLRGRLQSKLERLIGLRHFIPAGSGAAAVETALKVGLVTQTRGDYVLSLPGGFGGKTLFALTGTDSDRLKTNLQPLVSQSDLHRPVCGRRAGCLATRDGSLSSRHRANGVDPGSRWRPHHSPCSRRLCPRAARERWLLVVCRRSTNRHVSNWRDHAFKTDGSSRRPFDARKGNLRHDVSLRAGPAFGRGGRSIA